jgi:NADH-quinone oxidoreductase subunit N
VLASVVGAYYYVRIVKIMYFDEPAERFAPMPVELRVVLGVSGAFILLFVFIAGQVGSIADVAAKTFF